VVVLVVTVSELTAVMDRCSWLYGELCKLKLLHSLGVLTAILKVNGLLKAHYSYVCYIIRMLTHSTNYCKTNLGLALRRESAYLLLLFIIRVVTIDVCM